MCSNVVKPLASSTFLESLFGAHTRRVLPLKFDYCAVEFVHKFCENTMWHFFQTFRKTQLYLVSIFLWNRHVSLTNFQRIVNVLWVLLVIFHRNYRCFCFFSVSVLKPSIFSTKSPLAAFFHVVNRCSWKSLKLQQRKLTPSKHMAWVCSLVEMRQIVFDQKEKSCSFIVCLFGCLFDLGFSHVFFLSRGEPL